MYHCDETFLKNADAIMGIRVHYRTHYKVKAGRIERWLPAELCAKYRPNLVRDYERMRAIVHKENIPHRMKRLLAAGNRAEKKVDRVKKMSVAAVRSQARREECPRLTRMEMMGKCFRDSYIHLADPINADYRQRVLHTLETAYNSAVKVGKRLNARTPGDNTYGEITEALFRSFLLHPKVRPTREDKFLDVGCGVGQLVGTAATWFPEMRGAAGIEIEPKLEEIMVEYSNNLTRKSADLSLSMCPIEFLLGDFTKWSEDFFNMYKDVSILFCHNTAFGASTNNALEGLVLNLRDGARVIVAVQLGKGIGQRTKKTTWKRGEADPSSTKYNINSRLDEVELEGFEGGLSYTNKKTSFWLYTVNMEKERLLRQATEGGKTIRIGDLLQKHPQLAAPCDANTKA